MSLYLLPSRGGNSRFKKKKKKEEIMQALKAAAVLAISRTPDAGDKPTTYKLYDLDCIPVVELLFCYTMNSAISTPTACRLRTVEPSLPSLAIYGYVRIALSEKVTRQSGSRFSSAANFRYIRVCPRCWFRKYPLDEISVRSVGSIRTRLYTTAEVVSQSACFVCETDLPCYHAAIAQKFLSSCPNRRRRTNARRNHPPADSYIWKC